MLKRNRRKPERPHPHSLHHSKKQTDGPLILLLLIVKVEMYKEPFKFLFANLGCYKSILCLSDI